MRIVALALVATAGCYQQASNHAVPVTVVNDACSANATQPSCAAAAACEWRPVQGDCPDGTTCPDGVCATPDACAALTDRASCEADARCAWAGLRAASPALDLCPAGQSCDAGGYCHARDASGGGCTCVQPIACPANADCPAVQCDCSTPVPGASGAGGGVRTCTCTCPTCAPGETCPPCSCDCSSGGSCGGTTTGGGTGTCTCACPSCAAGTTCPPCDCACGSGNVGVSNAGSAPPLPPAAETPTDPCAHHTDAGSCAADTATSCRWIELGIVCVTAPCPTGACVQMKAVPGGGGCGCACPACAAGQSCPPCACDCCGQSGTGLGPVPVPT